MAETNGILSSSSGAAPFSYLTRGVFNDTFCGKHFLVVNPGISKYSLKVLETSLKYLAIYSIFKLKNCANLNKKCCKTAKR
jgi:hypothetical protein